MNQRPALGRGLGSLIPQKHPPEPRKSSLTEEVIPSARREVADIEIVLIKANPRQPRVRFSPGDLEDLVNSIREHGILQPLVVTKSEEGYELVAGERRLRASTLLGLKTVPAIVREATEQQKLEWALIENVQRQDLDAMEEAVAYAALLEEFQLTQEEVAKRVGKSRSAIANTIRLLELPEVIQDALKHGKITKSHARTLLAEQDPEKQLALFHSMMNGGVTVREAEARVAPKSVSRTTAGKDPNIAAHEKRLREILGTRIDITEKGGKGKIAISFYSREELMNLLTRLSE